MKQSIALILLLAALSLTTSEAAEPAKTPVIEEVAIEAARLPDLATPRAFHSTLCLDGELTVIGGHTSGFVPTPTAEYFMGGEWHAISTVYPHDNGFSIVLKSGKVLIGGGFAEPLGIGQTYTAELYDPKTHLFDGFSSLDTKRAGCTAVELSGGEVLISGNWYHRDNIERFDGKRQFSVVDSVISPRTVPFLFRTADNNAIIIGRVDTRGNHLAPSSTVQQLHGEAIDIPLLRTWQPMPTILEHRMADCFIGNEAAGEYAYLIVLENEAHQLAIGRVENADIQLLPTTAPLPLQTSDGKPITYLSPLVVDHLAELAYLVGKDSDNRACIVSIDYTRASEPEGAPITLYRSQPLEGIGWTTPVITPEGNIVMAGGTDGNNFAPTSAVWFFPVGKAIPRGTCGPPVWLLAVPMGAILFLLFACVLILRWLKRRSRKHDDEAEEPPLNTDELMQALNNLMQEQQPYLNSELKLSDVAAMMDVSPRAIGDCLRQQLSTTFVNYINAQRVEHAQKLMRQNPKEKIGRIGARSGFANDTSFFRTFKSITGSTPKEWQAAHAK